MIWAATFHTARGANQSEYRVKSIWSCESQGHGCDRNEESRFLTQATNKMEWPFTKTEKTRGGVSLVVAEG